MKKLLIAAIFMTGVSVSAYANADKGTETGSVQGTIIDAETKKPVANVTFSATIRKASFFNMVCNTKKGIPYLKGFFGKILMDLALIRHFHWCLAF